MSDNDPVREQIERDAVSFNPDSIYRITAVRDQQLKFFKKGATHQDPIAWNRCLDLGLEDLQDWGFDGFRNYLGLADIEGIVFHHPDGRMCKLRKSDYGIKR